MESPTCPRTPPHRADSVITSQLLTPPLSGGFPKRIQFLRQDTEVCPGSSFETNFQPGLLSPVVDCSSEERDINPKTTPVSVQAQAESVENGDDRPFRFMDLPLEVKNRIYKLLLTANGLICVRQNHTPGSYEQGAYIGADNRQLLPGISFALVQKHVGGLKSRLARLPYTNLSILRISRAINAESIPVLYSLNTFALSNLTLETAPPVNFSIPLFLPAHTPLMTTLVLTARTLYGLTHILNHGYVGMRNAYPGLETLTLILELDAGPVEKGYARKLAREPVEKWIPYVQRLHKVLDRELFGSKAYGLGMNVPVWIDLRVLFQGEAFNRERENEEYGKEMMKRAVAEAFELFKKGGKKGE